MLKKKKERGGGGENGRKKEGKKDRLREAYFEMFFTKKGSDSESKRKYCDILIVLLVQRSAQRTFSYIA